MLASELIARYEAYCPPELSLEGDSFGLQIGSLNREIKRVMVALDVREGTVAEAIAKQVDLIIVKHAPLFRPLKDLVVDNPATKMYLDLVKHDIAVYVSHTNIDVVDGGLNDWFCELLGINDVEVLKTTQECQGIGRVGNITPTSISYLGQQVKEAFKLDHVRLVTYGQPDQQMVSRIAICGGSGEDFYRDALSKGADVYITGDIYYHTAQDMLTQGLLAIDPGHHIEVLFVAKIAELLRQWQQENDWALDIIESTVNTNPFKDY